MRSDGSSNPFKLTPLPNYCFQRDPHIVLGDGVVLLIPRPVGDGGENFVNRHGEVDLGCLHVTRLHLRRGRGDIGITELRAEHLVTGTGIGSHQATDQFHGAGAAQDQRRLKPGQQRVLLVGVGHDADRRGRRGS